MSKRVKELLTHELKSRYSDADSALWVEFMGVDGKTNNEFRAELHEREVRLEIVRNSMFRRAVAGCPLEPLSERMKGPSALLTGGESLVDVAKIVHAWLPKMPSVRLRGAVLEGEYVDEQRVETLHKMPTKQEALARVAGAARSPGARLAAAIQSGGSNVAACVKALIEQLESGEEIRKSA
jgi:large subunit ribosomal protein L10